LQHIHPESGHAAATAELSAQHYELIQEEFGDGIMSAIDFDMTMERLPDPKGDRVKAQSVEIPPHPNPLPASGERERASLVTLV